MRSNVGELPGLGRLAAQLGATFIIVSNVLAYTRGPARRDALRPPRELAQRRGDDRGSALAAAGVRLGPAARRRVGDALTRSGPVSFFGADPEATRSHCPFVEADACAVAWHGGVSPCPPLLHTYTCFVRGREKRMLRWEVGQSARRVARRRLGQARLRRLPRPRPPLRLPALHRLRLRARREQRGGLPRQPAPHLRRLPLGARSGALCLR